MKELIHYQDQETINLNFVERVRSLFTSTQIEAHANNFLIEASDFSFILDRTFNYIKIENSSVDWNYNFGRESNSEV